MLIDISISLIIIFSIIEFFIQTKASKKFKHIQYINSILILLFFIDTFENFSLWINKLNLILCFIYFVLVIRNYFLTKKSSL